MTDLPVVLTLQVRWKAWLFHRPLNFSIQTILQDSLWPCAILYFKLLVGFLFSPAQKSFRILYPEKAQFKTDLKVKKLNRKLLKQLAGKKKKIQVFLLKILSKQQKPQLKPVRQTPYPFFSKYSFVFMILIFVCGGSLLLQVAGGGHTPAVVWGLLLFGSTNSGVCRFQ